MNSKLYATILIAGSLAFAQGPRGTRNENASRLGSGLDMTKVQTVEGAVASVHIGYGLQYPAIQIGQTTIKVAPAWFLLENDFEIKAGDKLRVSAAPSLLSSDPYLVALTLTNPASNATLALRDANGYPLWVAGTAENGRQPGPGTCGTCGLTSIATVSGTVDQMTAGAGIQHPVLVLKAADGKLITIKIGPERVLLAADFEIKVGEQVTVQYGLNCEGENVALELTNAQGKKIVLRDSNGARGWK